MALKKIAYGLILICFVGNRAMAQVSPPNAKAGTIIRVAKFKPPVVKTFLGRNSKTAVVTVDEANQLINLPLKITDEKNEAYTVTSYQFMYKKKSLVKNDETGKNEIVFTTVADIFKTTPLPGIWKSNIGGGIQKEEELYFFDILVKDKLNRIFYAPDIKISVQ